MLRECYPTLLHGLAINPTVAAAFIKYHAEAGHPDFKRFRSRLPADLPGVLATSLEALRTQIVENIAFDDSALINVVEGHMQATGNGASVISEASQPHSTTGTSWITFPAFTRPLLQSNCRCLPFCGTSC